MLGPGVATSIRMPESVVCSSDHQCKLSVQQFLLGKIQLRHTTRNVGVGEMDSACRMDGSAFLPAKTVVLSVE